MKCPGSGPGNPKKNQMTHDKTPGTRNLLQIPQKNQTSNNEIYESRTKIQEPRTQIQNQQPGTKKQDPRSKI
jgi:hypothetical protein